MYEIKDLTEPSRVIGASGNIATLWSVIDGQHFMTKPSLVIVRDGEVVAGEASLLDKMVDKQVYKFDDVVAMFN